MLLGDANRSTICITTLNRPRFIERTLEYYASERFGGVILIGDGSKGRTAEENQRIVEAFKNRLRVEWIDGSGLNQAETMSAMAARVVTDYAVYSGDDDYLVPQGLSDCEHFLDRNPDYVAAHGMGIALNADGAHGLPASIDPYDLPNLDQGHSLVRLESFLKNYCVGIFALHRTRAWQEMFRNVRHMPDKAIAGEVAPCAISATLGRCAELTGLYLARQIHTRRYHLPLLDDWILDPRFGQSARLLLDQLRTLIEREGSSSAPDREQLVQRTWHALMAYFFKEFDYVRSSTSENSTRKTGGNRPPHDQDAWLVGSSPDSLRYQAIFRNLCGNTLLHPPKPRMLLSWGNPYVMDEAISPILPDLSKQFSIVLLLVDYRLSREIRDKAFAWKDDGLIDDVLIAPSHGGSFAAHLYIRQLLPAIQRLEAAVFLSISAMQPYERYIIECGLPANCVRILFWPHPTNLFLYPELGAALANQRPTKEIEGIVEKIRRRIEPSVRRELARPSPGLLGILGFFVLNRATRMLAASKGTWLLRGRSSTSRRTTQVAQVKAVDDSGSPITNFLLRNPWIRPYGKAVTRVFPALRYLVEDVARFAHRRYKAYRARSRSVSVTRYGGQYPSWFMRWPTLRNLHVARTEAHFYYTLDRIIYPAVLVGRKFPFRRLDWITQIGTDDFDACLFFNEQDTALHKALFDNPNMYTVRYVAPERESPPVPINAILHPFSVHGKSDLTPELLEVYRRDLAIALKESGASEVHIRPHPGAIENWLDFLVGELRERGIPCCLVPASRPISEVAASYKGVISAVSGSLRDARLACPDIFVVGSVGLSISVFKDPKRVVGFPESIGWIEEDGTYDPRIFRPAAHDMRQLPTAAEVVNRLAQGSWARKPARLTETLHPVAHVPSTPLSP